MNPVDRLFRLQVVLSLALLAPGALMWDFWIAELFIHWQLWVAGALAVPVLWFLLRRRSVLVGAACLGLGWGCIAAWPYSSFAGPEVPRAGSSDTDSVVVASVNLLQDLGDHGRALDWVLARDPDLVVIQEVTPSNAYEIRDRLTGSLPHHHCAPSTTSFGLGVASRWPISVRPLSRDEQHQFLVAVEAPRGPLLLAAVHVRPPMRGMWAAQQREMLDALAERVGKARVPVVMAGDLNLTPWSPSYRQFLDRTGLRDPRVGRGVYGTWGPPSLGTPPLIPIDHVLVSQEWKADGIEVGPAFGSDHRPLLVKLVR